jgi:hypothetical protein
MIPTTVEEAIMDFLYLISLYVLCQMIWQFHEELCLRKRRLMDAREREANEKLKIAIADSEFQENLMASISMVMGQVTEIAINHLEERGRPLMLMIAGVNEEARWGYVAENGIWSDRYLSLMKILKDGIPGEIFDGLDKVNQSVIVAFLEGRMIEGESLYLCERRRRQALEKLGKAMAELKRVSSRMDNAKQISCSAD